MSELNNRVQTRPLSESMQPLVMVNKDGRQSLVFNSDVIRYSPGQLVLGKYSGAIKSYVTRYRINRLLQSPSTCMGAVHRTISPCSSTESSANCVDFLTAVLRSETFLILIYILTLTVSVVKEGLDWRAHNDKLHFVATVFENVLCIAAILLRVFAVYNEYKDVNESLSKIEATENETIIYSKSMRMWSIVFTLISSGTIFLVVAAFVLLHLYAHLGWTILTTNASLLLMLTVHYVLRMRNELAPHQLMTDHLRVVLLESHMYLKEGLCFRGWVNQDFLQRCRHFVLAYDVTREFQQVDYIDMCEDDQLCVSLNVSTVWGDTFVD